MINPVGEFLPIRLRLPLLLLLLLLRSNEAFAAPGYYNLVMPPGYSMLANVLATSSNTVESVFQEFPAVFVPMTLETNANGVTIFKIESTGYRANNYFNGWSAPKMVLNPGEGWFFKNPHSLALAAMLVGEMVGGTNELPAGFSVCSSIVAQQGGLSSVLQFPATNGDEIHVFTNCSYSVYTFSNTWSPTEPFIQIGESFWVRKSAPARWVRDLGPSVGSSAVSQNELVSQVAQLNFFTFNAVNSGMGQVLDVDGMTPLSTNCSGQLYAGASSNENFFVALGTPVSFLGSSGSGYIRSDVVSVPFVAGGQNVYVQLRAWRQSDGETFEVAAANGGPIGRSATMLLATHATIEGGRPGYPPPDVNDFPSFHLEASPPLSVRLSATNVLIAWPAPSTGFVLEEVVALGTTNWINVTNVPVVVGGEKQVVVSPLIGTRFYRLTKL